MADPISPRRRLVLGALAAGGLLVAAYLTAYQVGLLDAVWDPVFSGSPKVLGLTEPLPDAAAGVAAYGLELVLTVAAVVAAARARPAIAAAFGALIATGVVVSAALVLVQALVARAWCTLCLASAAISLALFVLGAPEGLAGSRALLARRARVPRGRAPEPCASADRP